jgi:V8-like Glu-specific endopeptidase
MAKQFLELNERMKLIKSLAGLDDFAFVQGRRTQVELAGLARFLPGLGMDSVPRQFASQLVLALEKFGRLDPPSTFHALGALLGSLLQMDDLPHDDRRFLAQLIVKYGLSSDSGYIDELRAQYGIQEKPQAPQVRSEQVPDVSRLAAPPPPQFKVEIKDERGLEQIINSEDNFLDLYLLSGALQAARAVCLIEIPQGAPRGTGFLVGPDLVLTNHHVIPDQAMLESVVARFDYMQESNGGATTGRAIAVRTDFYRSSPAEQLDYALVKLHSAPLAGDAGHRGYQLLSARSLVPDERVNIIQHPKGRPIKVVLTQNHVVKVSPTRVHYVADTLDGSSGSPVFDRHWRVVALHHSAQPYPPESDKDAGKWTVNEGITMKPIMSEIQGHLPAV